MAMYIKGGTYVCRLQSDLYSRADGYTYNGIHKTGYPMDSLEGDAFNVKFDIYPCVREKTLIDTITYFTLQGSLVSEVSNTLHIAQSSLNLTAT